MQFFLRYCRNNSVKELEAFAENANAVNRLILRHLSISEAYQPSNLRASEAHDRSMPIFSMPHDKDNPLFSSGGDDSDQDEHDGGSGDNGMFFIGDHVSEGSDEDQPDEPPILWMGLTPPGNSSLAKRRLAKKNSESDEQDDSEAINNQKQAAAGKLSPSKVPSAMF